MKPIPFNNTYVNLGNDFYVRTAPSPVSNPALIVFNQALGDALGLSETRLNSPEGTAILAGNRVPEGAEPLAMAYAGHQSETSFLNWGTVARSCSARLPARTAFSTTST